MSHDTSGGQFALRRQVEQAAYRRAKNLNAVQSTISDGMLIALCHRRETLCQSPDGRRVRRGHPCAGGLVFCVLLLFLPGEATAQPDFSQSTITREPPAVVEGDVVTYTVNVRNTGAEAAPHADIVLTLPLEGLFIDLDGLDGATVDRDGKQVTATIDLPSGSERRFRFRMLVPRDAGGNLLNPHLEVRYLFRGVTFNASEPTEIGTAPPAGGVRLGGVRIRAIEAAVLGVIALYPVLWFVLPRRQRNHGGVAAVVISTGFLLMFAGLAWRDAQTLIAWPEAQCGILDTRMRVETEASRLRPTQPRRAENRNYKPLLALEYAADGRTVISSGYETGTRVSIGRGESLQREYAQWNIGDRVPCWFNPDDVKDVIVIRGFGGSYFFAILPLALLASGVYMLRHG
jgi:uncharacterized repeat protein (TIGR01451 family)